MNNILNKKIIKSMYKIAEQVLVLLKANFTKQVLLKVKFKMLFKKYVQNRRASTSTAKGKFHLMR